MLYTFAAACGVPVFVFERRKRALELGGSFLGQDDLVDEAPLGGDIGRHELDLVLFAAFVSFRRGIGGRLDLPTVHDVHSTLGAHDCGLGDRPGKHDVRTHALAVHGDVRPSKISVTFGTVASA